MTTTRMKTAVGFTVSLLGFLVTACTAATDDVVSADLDVVVGTITGVILRDDDHLQIVVQNAQVERSQSRYDTIVVFAAADTPIFVMEEEGSLYTVTSAAVSEGNLIRAYFDGTMLRSLPPGIGAVRIEITLQP